MREATLVEPGHQLLAALADQQEPAAARAGLPRAARHRDVVGVADAHHAHGTAQLEVLGRGRAQLADARGGRRPVGPEERAHLVPQLGVLQDLAGGPAVGERAGVRLHHARLGRRRRARLRRHDARRHHRRDQHTHERSPQQRMAHRRLLCRIGWQSPCHSSAPRQAGVNAKRSIRPRRTGGARPSKTYPHRVISLSPAHHPVSPSASTACRPLVARRTQGGDPVMASRQGRPRPGRDRRGRPSTKKPGRASAGAS